MSLKNLLICSTINKGFFSRINSKQFALLFVSLLFLVLFSFNVLASDYISHSQTDFNEGVYNNSFYDYISSMVELNVSSGQNNGSYLSKIFSPLTNSSWNYLNLIKHFAYGVDLPDNQQSESFYSGFNMSNNILLFHFDNDSSKGENSSNLYDYSGLTNNVVTVENINTAPFSLDAIFNKSFQLDSSHSERIKISNMSIGSEVTISTWAKLKAQGDMLWTINDNNHGPDLWFQGGNIYLNTWDSSNNPFCAQPSNVDEWHNYVTVISPGTNTTKLYIDGVFCGNASYRDPTNDILFIGSSSTSYTWDGSVDEFAVFNSVLSDEEIRNLYARGVADLNIFVRSCDDENCTGENFTSLSNDDDYHLLSSEVLNNSFFQYFVQMSTTDLTVVPSFYNSTINYDLLDFEDPVIHSFNFNSSVEKRSSVKLLVNASDDVGISSVKANILYPDNSHQLVVLMSQGEGIYTYDFSNTSQTGNYSLELIVEDVVGKTVSQTKHLDVNLVPWWNNLFRYRYPIRLDEQNSTSRTNYPQELHVDFIDHQAKNNSLRVTDSQGNELYMQIVNATMIGDFYSSVNFVVLVNSTANQQQTIYLYYTDENVSTQEYDDFFTYSKDVNSSYHTFRTNALEVILHDKYDSDYAGITSWKLLSGNLSGSDLLLTQDNSSFASGIISWGDIRDTLGLDPILIANGSVYKTYRWIKQDGVVDLTFFRGTDYIRVNFEANDFTNYFSTGDENSIMYSASNINMPDVVYSNNFSENFSSGVTGWSNSFRESNLSQKWFYLSNSTQGFVTSFNHFSEFQELFAATYDSTVQSLALEYNSLQPDFEFFISYIQGNSSDAQSQYIEMTQPLIQTVYKEEIPQDNQEPLFLNVNILPNNVEVNSTVKIRAEVVDNFEVVNVTAFVEYPNSTIVSLGMGEINSNIYETEFNASQEGNYNIYLESFDGWNNLATTQNTPSLLKAISYENVNSTWYDYNWNYKLPIVIDSVIYDRINDLAELEINLTAVLIQNNISGTLDFNSLRLVDDTLRSYPLLYNSSTNLLSFVMNGSILRNQNKTYDLYFDVIENGLKTKYSKLNWLNDTYIVTGGTSGLVYEIPSNNDGTFDSQNYIDDVGSNTWGLGISDFDNDGDYDFVAGNSLGELYYFRHLESDSSFDSKKWIGNFSANNYAMDIATGDYDNDGNQDIVIGGNNNDYDIFLGQGNGSFTHHVITTTGAGSSGNTRGKDSADIDNDGCIDFIAGTTSVNTYFWKGNCDGTFQNPTLLQTMRRTNQYGIVAGDFDEDGFIDAYLNAYNLAEWEFSKGNGDGSFQEEVLLINDSDYWNPGDNFDFNGDGHQDLITTDYNNRRVYFYEGFGNGSFHPKVMIADRVGANRMGLATPTVERITHNFSLSTVVSQPDLVLSTSYLPLHPSSDENIDFFANVSGDGIISSCKISIDSSNYGLMLSEDGFYDESFETAKYSSSLSSGTHNISIKCFDDSGIRSSEDFVVNVTSVDHFICGNGVKDFGEDCDGSDGLVSGYTCSSTCELIENSQNSGLGGSSGASSGASSGGSSSGGFSASLFRNNSLEFGTYLFDINSSNSSVVVKINSSMIYEFEVFSSLINKDLQVKLFSVKNLPFEFFPSSNEFVYSFEKVLLDKRLINSSSSYTLRFKVSKDWIGVNNINISSIYLGRFVDGELIPLNSTFISQDDTYVYYSANTPGFSYFAILGSQKVSPSELVVADLELPSITPITSFSKLSQEDINLWWRFKHLVLPFIFLFVASILGIMIVHGIFNHVENSLELKNKKNN